MTNLELLKPTPVGTYLSTGETLYILPPLDVYVREDRHRQKFNRKPLDNLIDSIREVGQLQPGICHTNEEGKIELIVGERRLRCCIVLKLDFHFLLKEEIKDKLLLEQMQLDENLVREDLAWQEEIKAKARLHEVLTERYGKAKSGIIGGHRLVDTAEHLGSKLTSLYEDVTLATFLAIPEVAAAPNKTTAKKIAKRMIEQVQRRESLQVALEVQAGLINEKPKLTDIEQAEAKLKRRELEIKLSSEGMEVSEARTEAANWVDEALMRKRVDDKEVFTKSVDELYDPDWKEKREKEIEQVQARQALDKNDFLSQQLIYFSKRCILGKMEEELQTYSDSHFDVVCFDPPWGVNFDKVSAPSPGTKAYEDSWDRFWTSLESWLELIYSKMKDDSHLYMFFGIVSHNFVYDTLEKVGFTTNRMPLIWHKKGAHVTRNPLVWPGRSYEPIAYARKGNKPLLIQGAPDVISTPMPTASIKDIHPSAKHPDIYIELLKRSANPGNVILDPMAGSGMFGVAAESLQKTHALNWVQIEEDQDYRNLQLLNLTKGYNEIAKTEAKASLEADLRTKTSYEDYDPVHGATSFKTILPGTEEWTAWWKSHPEDQEAMLAWRQNAKK